MNRIRKSSKQPITFRLNERDAEALAAALAEAASKDSITTPGLYAQEATLEKLRGGPLQQIARELAELRKVLQQRIAALEHETAELREQLDQFHKHFLRAVDTPEWNSPDVSARTD
jgi:hypothetical protein